jgi:methanogenic corrinoid protein MtbC1
MIKWCSICQKFIGEKEPFEVYELTHGVCKKCVSHQGKCQEDKKKFLEFKKFFHHVLNMDPMNIIREKDKIVRKGLSLGIDPISLCYGILQPAMYRLGGLVHEGKVGIIEEHYITNTIEKIVGNFEGQYDLSTKGSDIVIAGVSGNYHTLGLRVLNLALAERGIDSTLIYPSVPSHELIRFLEKNPHKIVCLSIAVREQFQALLKMINDLNSLDLKLRPLIAIGGFGLRLVDTSILEVDFIQNLNDNESFFRFVQDSLVKKAA